jgi:hypothetical protein
MGCRLSFYPTFLRFPRHFPRRFYRQAPNVKHFDPETGLDSCGFFAYVAQIRRLIFMVMLKSEALHKARQRNSESLLEKITLSNPSFFKTPLEILPNTLIISTRRK